MFPSPATLKVSAKVTDPLLTGPRRLLPQSQRSGPWAGMLDGTLTSLSRWLIAHPQEDKCTLGQDSTSAFPGYDLDVAHIWPQTGPSSRWYRPLCSVQRFLWAVHHPSPAPPLCALVGGGFQPHHRVTFLRAWPSTPSPPALSKLGQLLSVSSQC